MTQGENAREVARLEILKLSIDGQNHNFSEFSSKLKDQFSKNTIIKYLNEMIEGGLLEKKPGKAEESFRPKYRSTPEGQEWFAARMADDLKKACQTLHTMIDTVFTDENLSKLHNEAGWIPSQEAVERRYLTSRDLGELLKHKKETIGPLRDVFVKLAKTLMKVEGPIGVAENLENVTFRFKAGQPFWSLYGMADPNHALGIGLRKLGKGA